MEPSASQERPSDETDPLDRWVSSLRAHVEARDGATDPPLDDECLRACCMALVTGPLVPGVEPLDPSPHDRVRSVLEQAPRGALPEIDACRLWLSCANGLDVDMVTELAPLAEKPLWEPMEAIIYRVLAHLGRRRTLAEIVLRKTPLTLARADALFEASLGSMFERDRIEQIAADPESVWPASLCDRWKTLLRAEWSVASGEANDPLEQTLTSLMDAVGDGPAQDLADVEVQRIAARASAARVRMDLTRGRVNNEGLTHPAAQGLPIWERAVLQALTYWRLGDVEAATAELDAALAHNPHQTSIRLALACLRSPDAPEAALAVLDHDEPTRQVLISRAALLARTGRYDEAAEALPTTEEQTPVGLEALRYRWLDAQHRFERQAHALRTALAERRGDWHEADAAWRQVCTEQRTNALRVARQMFVAQRELSQLAEHQTWRQGLAKQRLQQAGNEIGGVPLVADARFFRGLATTSSDPERAVKDLRTLSRSRTWVQAEQRAGGGRLLAVGDALARLGQTGDAVRAYALAAEASPATAGERLAVAAVYAAIGRAAASEEIARSADRADELAPNSPWPPLMTALGLLIAGDWDAAQPHLARAQERGAPEDLVRCLRCVSQGVSDPGTLSTDELADLGLPKPIEALVHLAVGDRRDVRHLEAFAAYFGPGWIDAAPGDPAPLARRLLASLCDDDRWDDALAMTDDLVRSGRAWAIELAATVRARHAMLCAVRGNLDQAAEALEELSALLERAPGQDPGPT